MNRSSDPARPFDLGLAELRAQARAGLLIQGMAGAFVGSAIAGPITAFVAIPFTLLLGADLCHVSAVLTSAMMLSAIMPRRPPWRTKAVWFLLGCAIWAATYWIGVWYFNWHIEGTVLAGSVGASVISMAGLAYAGVLWLSEDKGSIQDTSNKRLTVILIRTINEVLLRVFSKGRAGIIAAGVIAAFWDALGGAFCGGVVGAFSGNSGEIAFRGVLGGALAGAVLCGLGGTVGVIHLARLLEKEHRPELATIDDAGATPDLTTSSDSFRGS